MGSVEFCGEMFILPDDRPFRVGREGDLALDDNRHLHRNFLAVNLRNGLWWLDNDGVNLLSGLLGALVALPFAL